MDVGVVFKDDFWLTRLTTPEELTIASPRNNYLHLRKGAVYEIPFDCGFRHTLEKPEQSLIRKMAEHGTDVRNNFYFVGENAQLCGEEDSKSRIGEALKCEMGVGRN